MTKTDDRPTLRRHRSEEFRGGLIMRYVLGLAISLLFFATPASADSGLVDVTSSHGVKATADRLEAGLKERGMTLFNRIDHAAGAATVGERLRPMELLIFGSPAVGTALIQCGQTIGIDLPLKALVWEDEKGGVRLSYNDPTYLVARHAGTGCEEIVKKIAAVISALAKTATEP